MMSLSTINAFDCEKECKIHQTYLNKNVNYFKFSERDGVCELYEWEFRNGCQDLSGPLVSTLDIDN